jgi:cytochrome P450
MTDPSVATDADLFSAEAVEDPYPMLAELRELAPAVYSTKYDFYVLTRYEDVREAARNWEGFTSSQGVALTREFNERIAGSVLATDPPEHDALRAVLSDKLAPRGLAVVRGQIAAYAAELVAELVARGRFDGVTEIARVFPINVVADLVGFPAEGREKMQPGADATFSAFGPFGEYAQQHLPLMADYGQWMAQMADRTKLAPGGWGEAVMDAVDDGRLSRQGASKTFNAYLTAGMDTTVNAIGALLRIFAEREDIWNALKAQPSLAGPIFEEVLRFESPVVGFWRVATRDAHFDATTVPKGSRVLLHWAAANRDPRKYRDPDLFDIDRNPIDHVAFGSGIHACAGQGLARVEVVTLLAALAEQIDEIHLDGPAVRGRNPIVRGYDSVPLRVTARHAK